MQDMPASQGVSRLKELLFEPESQAILDLRQCIQALADIDTKHRQELLDRLAQIAAATEAKVAAVADADAKERQELARRIEALFERTGTDERFRISVANALDGALREAELAKHQELASAMAPLVVRTIKTEIRASHDEIAEGLFPHIGRMVKAYVLSAMKDLADQINRRLEHNGLVLRIRSWTLGRPVSELAMADTMRLEVEELYLIRRGTGELVGRWPQAAAPSNRDHVLGGTLSAINEFATDAFQGDASSLRRIDLGTAQIYLRASPLYLLAAKCTGTAARAVEQVVDECVLAGIEQNGSGALAEATLPGERAGQLLAPVATTLQQRIAAKQEEIAVPPLGFGPLKWMAALIILPLLALAGWWLWLDLMTTRTRTIAEETVAGITELASYPTRIEVERGGKALTLTGLAPTAAARTATASRLAEVLPTVEIRERLVVLPNQAAEAERLVAELKRNVSGIENSLTSVERNVKQTAAEAISVRKDLVSIEDEISRTALQRLLVRAANRIVQTRPDLARLEGELTASAERGTVREIIESAERLQSGMRSRAATATGHDADSIRLVLFEWRRALATINARLTALVEQRAALPVTEAPADGRAIEIAEDIAAGVERMSALTGAALHTNALRLSMPSSREQLARFVRDHAIFFANNTDYRDEAAANAALDRLVQLMRETETSIRVVGYTDERGGQQRNTSLSQSRADKVVEALVQRGIPRERLVALGRLNSIDLSPSTGAGSPNRRVEFEIGFIGEMTP